MEELHQPDLGVEPLEQEYEGEEIFDDEDNVDLRLELPLGVFEVDNVPRRGSHERDCAIDFWHGYAKASRQGDFCGEKAGTGSERDE